MTMKSLSRLKHGAAWDEAGQQVWENSLEGQNRLGVYKHHRAVR